jgi:alpha-tubulin suppressor-like RCC1 family protein
MVMRWFLLLIVSASAVWAQFPLPMPTRPTSFPLVITNQPGTVVGWGRNDETQISIPADLTNAVQIEAGNFHSIALRATGIVQVWGWNGYGELNMPPGLSGVSQIAAGLYHNIAVKTDGSVIAWGRSDFGQTSVPPNLAQVVQAAAGFGHSVALRADGTVVVWGASYPNLDVGQANLSIPTGLSDVVQIAAHNGHTLALRANGTVAAWGRSDSGQTNVPVSLSNVVQVAAGFDHSLALKSDGTVVAWGGNEYGKSAVPSGLTNVVQISAGLRNSLALLSNGTVIAWGDNTWQGLTPPPPNLSNIIGLAAGKYAHVLALRMPAPDTPMFALETLEGSAITHNAGAVAFDATLVGLSSSSRVYVIRNNGSGDLRDIAVSTSGLGSAHFEFSVLPAFILPAGASTNFSVSFQPTIGGAQQAQLSITSNDTNNSPFVINLSGFGLGEDLDSDGDGLNDAAEFTMSSLGFDWQSSQPTLVTALYSNANRAQLFTQSQYENNRTAGQQDVIANPMAFSLYDSTSIMDLRMGGLMIQKQGTDATIVFQPQTTTDLVTLPFTNNGTPITNTVPMPGDKGFLRVGAIYVPAGDLPSGY